MHVARGLRDAHVARVEETLQHDGVKDRLVDGRVARDAIGDGKLGAGGGRDEAADGIADLEGGVVETDVGARNGGGAQIVEVGGRGRVGGCRLARFRSCSGHSAQGQDESECKHGGTDSSGAAVRSVWA